MTGADTLAWEPAPCLCGLTDRGRPLFAVPHPDAPAGRTFVVQCHCGLRRLDPRPTAATVSRYYAEASDYHAYVGRRRSPLKQALWDALRDSQAAPAVRPLWVRLASPLLRPLARWQFDVNVRLNGRSLRVLDVGSGFGDVLIYLQSRGCRTLGIDLSPEAAERARQYGVDVRVGTMQSMQLTPGGFDVVIMSHSLEHVPHPADEIGEAWRLLAPGGRLLLAVPNGDAVRLRVDGPHWSCLMAPFHFWFFDAASLRSLIERHGFHVDSVRTTTRHYALIEWFLGIRSGYAGAATASFFRYLGALPFGARDGDILRIEATRPGLGPSVSRRTEARGLTGRNYQHRVSNVHWTIARRLTAGFAAVLLITVVLGGFAWVEAWSLANQTRSITGDALPGVQAVMRATAMVSSNRAAMLEHLATIDPARKASIEQEMDRVSAQLTALYAEYEKSISGDQERALFAAIAAPRAAYRQARAEKFLPLSRIYQSAGAMSVFDTDVEPAFAKYMRGLDALVAYHHTRAEAAGRSVERGVAVTSMTMAIGVLAALLVGVGAAWLIIRAVNRALHAVVRELSEGAEEVTAASGQLATSSQSLSRGAAEQAASLEQTSASMIEMASMTRQNAERSRSAATLMTAVDSRVQGFNQALGDMVASMASIRESSQEVAKIIKTIDEIAFQTNILALNAAVEAARAGESGMGFAVVADEVRNLAQRSAQAARETTALVEHSIDKAERGSAHVQQVATAISGITESVSKVKGLAEEVSVASRDQAQGIDQVSQAITHMEQMTQTTAATAEESAAASEALTAQAEGAMAILDRLEQLVGARARRRATVARS